MEENLFLFILKNAALFFFIVFCFLGIVFWGTQLEKSNIERLRYCPHCGQRLIE